VRLSIGGWSSGSSGQPWLPQRIMSQRLPIAGEFGYQAEHGALRND